MNNNELTLLVKEISIVYFNQEFENSARFNSRLRTTGGRFHLNDGHIDINPKVLNKLGMDILIGTIKHELCHYHLYKNIGKHTHGSKEFKRLLENVGGLRYVPDLSELNYKEYMCKSCGAIYKRKRIINTKKFLCGRCRGNLVLIKK